MCDFDDDFGEEGFMDEDSFENHFEDQMDDEDKDKWETSRQNQGIKPDGLNPFWIGGAMGFGYEEGLTRFGKKIKRNKN